MVYIYYKVRWLGAVALLLALLLAGCQGNKHSGGRADAEKTAFRYAERIKMVRHPHFTVVTLSDPWNEGKTLHTYILVDRKDSAMADHLPKGTLIYTPVERGVVFTSAHCKLLEYLGCLDQIVGVADLKYIHAQAIQQRVKAGRVADCGDGMAPALEKIVELQPQALLLSPFESSGGYGKLSGLGIPIIETADYMETSPLGRAEWMRFYGMLFGQERRADSLFNVVDSVYQCLRTEAHKWQKGRSVLTERKTGSVWYCPGGKSTIGQMIADANGGYAFSGDRHSGSLPLSFEEVLERAGQSDIWAFKYNGGRPMTREDLLAEYHGYEGLKAFREGQIYQCNASVKPYFEETPFRPDYLLRELIIMLHPEASSLGRLRYYEKMAP